MGKHLVLVGGGHAHLSVLTRLDRFTQDGGRATVISRSAYHYYSGMGPGLLSGEYAPRDLRFNVRRMTEDRGGRFVEDAVVRVDPVQRRLYRQRGAPIPYDVVSFNTGSGVAFDAPRDPGIRSVFPVKPIENLLAVREAVRRRLKDGPLTLCVAGGGPAGRVGKRPERTVSGSMGSCSSGQAALTASGGAGRSARARPGRGASSSGPRRPASATRA